MTRLLKEPLLHFIVLGAALFGLFNLVNQKGAEQPAKIVISVGQVANLADGFARTWNRLPSQDELRGLLEDHIRAEVYYREAKALGLDRDDAVVRRRLRQKLEFLTEDMVAEPTEAELQTFLTANAERFKSDDRFTFTHVFLSDARRDGLEPDAAAIATKLSTAHAEADLGELGDNFLLGYEFRDVPRSSITQTFGDEFVAKLSKLELGRWEGPLASGYGMHFVRISDHVQGGLMQLDSVRTVVRREWMNERRLQAEADLYRALRERYQVVVEEPPAERAIDAKVSGVSQ
jgi:hypothetical protein